MLHNQITPSKGVSSVVLALTAAAGCAFAQIEETELAPVTVSASDGIAIPVDEVGVSVTVLDTEELREEGVFTLSEALTYVPGAYVQPSGGLEQRGSTSKMVLRGMNSGQSTLPVLDGMRLYNSADVGNLSPNIIGAANIFDIGTLEVLRGGQAAVYGAGNIGGVLYMETPKGSKESSVELFSEYGSFNSSTSNITAQGTLEEKLAYFVSSTYGRTDNDVRYADGSRPSDDKVGEYEAWQQAMRMDYKINEKNSLTLSYRRSDTDYEAAYGRNSIQNNFVTATLRSEINDIYSTKLMTGYYSADYDLGNYYSELDTYQVDWDSDFTWSKTHSSRAGINWNRNEGEVPQDSRQNGIESIIGVYVGHRYEPSENWENTVDFRIDHSSVYGNNFSYRAASNYKFNQDKTRVFASLSSGYESPTIFERGSGVFDSSYYWGGVLYSNLYKGNPDLEVGTTLSIDFGVEQEITKNHKLSFTLFWSQIYDGIETYYSHYDATAGASIYSYRNRSSVVTSQGIEIALRGEWKDAWNTGYVLNCTITQPKNSQDVQLADTARQTWSADIHTSPIEKLTLGLGFVGAVDRTSYMDGDRMDNYFVMRFFANYQINENVTLHMRVENLTDEDYVTSPGYVDMLGSGTAVYGGISIKF